MIKQIAWNTFKNTGDINTMMELIEVDKAIKNKQQNIEPNVQTEENKIQDLLK